MQGTILVENLDKGLAMVSRVVASRGQMPVLANVLIEAKKEGYSLAATNLELGMRVEVGGKVTGEGAITVPARNLAEFVNQLASESVDLEIDGEKLRVEGGKYGASFTGIAAAEFPVLPRGGGGVKINKKIIEEVAREVAFAAAADESRPVLTGVKFEGGEKELAVTATDGFRLARKKIQISKMPELRTLGKELILPARTIMEVARMAGESGEKEIEVEEVKDSNQVIFTCGKVQLVSRVLEGNYPEIEKIIPSDWKTQVGVEKEELTRAVRAAAVFARENNNIIKFLISNSKFLIKAAGGQTGESEIEIEIEIEGEEAEIAFNYRYVLDCLNSMEGERVILQTSGNLAPAVWRVEKRDDLLQLVMPVRV